jgi:hypothetical protein
MPSQSQLAPVSSHVLCELCQCAGSKPWLALVWTAWRFRSPNSSELHFQGFFKIENLECLSAGSKLPLLYCNEERIAGMSGSRSRRSALVSDLKED